MATLRRCESIFYRSAWPLWWVAYIRSARTSNTWNLASLGCPIACFMRDRLTCARRFVDRKDDVYTNIVAPNCLFVLKFQLNLNVLNFDNKKFRKSLWAVDHSARESMKSAAKRDNYCELQDILSSNNLNANGGFGYSWSHVRLRVDNWIKLTNIV